MITIFIRFFFTLLSSFHIYNKLLNKDHLNKRNLFFNFLFSVSLATINAFLQDSCATLRITLTFAAYLCHNVIFGHTKLVLSFVVSSISYAQSYILFFISNFVISIFATPLYYKSSAISLFILTLLSSCLQCVLAVAVFKIRRLKNGMPFLLRNQYFLSCIILSFMIITYFALVTTFPSYTLLHIIALLIAIFLTSLLFYWWKRKITQTYVEKLRLDEREWLYKKISEKEQEIDVLNKHNAYLAKVIHKDNKLIPAMELAVRRYLKNASDLNSEEAGQYGKELLSQLESMSAEREGILHNYHEDTRAKPQVGLCSIDAIILYMEKRAVESDIRYETRYDNGLKESLTDFIEEGDALHLLSDLIENAIIAARQTDQREILIHLGFSQDFLFFDIYDSGVPFTIETYQNLGNQRYTTYADTGGSGIGLMDIWKLKRKYRSSLQIYEFAPGTNTFTKKIRILFDRRNHFLLQTYRAKEIQTNILRNDLHVFSYNDYSPPEISEEPAIV